MADFNENELRMSAHSPKFLNQRKIAYVDNPFDEQASQSMVQKCDIRYMNFPRNVGRPRLTGESSGLDAVQKRNGEEDKEDLLQLGVLGKDERDLASCEQDWSCLFSPVQVNIISVKITRRYWTGNYC